MKALIKVGYGCNDHCSFCHTLDVRHVDAEAREVHQKIARAKALGHTMVVLSGGEPTIRPELLAWASHVAKLGMDFGLVTNGRMLSYPALVEQLMERRLRYVYLSLHGGTAKIHNLMVRSEAFTQTYGALDVLSGRGLDFTANCVITKHNVEHLVPLVDSVLGYDDLTLKFSMVEPKGGGSALFRQLMPQVSHVAQRVQEAIDYGKAKVGGGPGPRFRHGAIPLCLMQGYEDTFDDLKTHRFATMIEVGEPDFYPVDDLNKIQPVETCRGCSLSGPCPGLYRGYHEAFGDDELHAVEPRPRSNSFDFVFEALVPGRPDGGCPIAADGVTPWERGRHIFVQHGPRIARFFAPTRDFSDAEVAEVKHGLGQVYLDVSNKDAPDDFTTDLRPLRRSELCVSCEHRDVCAGMFEPALDDDPFTRDDSALRALLETLEGVVVDIGCGRGRYPELFGARVREGRVDYRAIDPSEGDVAAYGEALGREADGLERSVTVGTAESWADAVEPESVDHVLAQVIPAPEREPGRFVDAVRRALRPGGSLIVVDDAAFGLARTPRKTAQAQASSAEFEHYRNDTAADAARTIDGRGLNEVERRDTSAQTSTLWLLRYERAG